MSGKTEYFFCCSIRGQCRAIKARGLREKQLAFQAFVRRDWQLWSALPRLDHLTTFGIFSECSRPQLFTESMQNYLRRETKTLMNSFTNKIEKTKTGEIPLETRQNFHSIEMERLKVLETLLHSNNCIFPIYYSTNQHN